MTDIRLKPPKGLKIPTPAAWRGSGGPISLWLVLTGLAMAAVGLAGLWWFWNAYIADKPLPAKPASPSHVEFRPPSYFVTTPAKPILPDNGAVKDATREKPQAYEEALAHDIRQTYVRPKPEPAAAPPPEMIGSPPPVAARPAEPPPVPPADQPADRQADPPWRRFAAAAPAAQGKPRIVIVIDDMGLDKKRSARAAALPGPLTLSYLTYAKDTQEQADAAKRAGHELMLHVPMEPNDKGIDPGPNVLLAGAPAADIHKRLAWALDRLTGYVGVNNHMGSRFTRDAEGMDAVMEELSRRGLLFLDSRTTGNTVAAAAAARLKELESLARTHGHAVAIGHPKDKTLDALAAWLPTLKDKAWCCRP